MVMNIAVSQVENWLGWIAALKVDLIFNGMDSSTLHLAERGIQLEIQSQIANKLLNKLLKRRFSTARNKWGSSGFEVGTALPKAIWILPAVLISWLLLDCVSPLWPMIVGPVYVGPYASLSGWMLVARRPRPTNRRDTFYKECTGLRLGIANNPWDCNRALEMSRGRDYF